MLKQSFLRIYCWTGALMAGITLGLTGCATTTVAARVTSFQQWPTDAEGQSYQFVVSDASQNNNLEYQTYQDMVRAGIGVTGLVEAQGSVQPRFHVSFKYGSTQTQIMVRQPYGPYFYGNYRYWPDPRWGGQWGPNWVDLPTVAYRNSLSLEIHDTTHGAAEVYRSSAYIITEHEDLPHIMPYLVRAIFDNFPGNNGTERRIDYPIKN